MGGRQGGGEGRWGGERGGGERGGGEGGGGGGGGLRPEKSGVRICTRSKETLLSQE